MVPATAASALTYAETANFFLTAQMEHYAKKDFPLRVGAVDIGSNAIRFTAAEFLNSSRSIVLESERAPVRLGSAAFSKGRLSQDEMQNALQALARFKQRLRILNIPDYRIIATSAVRESANGEQLAVRAREQLGLTLEIVSGSEETQLVYRSVQPLIKQEKRPWLLANLGGGSLEVAVVNGGGVLSSQTHTVGAVRLLEDFKKYSGSPGQFLHLLEEYVATLHLVPAGTRTPLAGIIATGGNIEELAKLAHAPQNAAGARELSLAALNRLLGELQGLTVRQRIARWGLNQDRADVILPAAVVYAQLCAAAGQAGMLVPYAGTKEGILLDLVDRLTHSTGYARRREQQLIHLAVSLGRRYHFDEAHGRQVCRLALSLFEQLQNLHGLDDDDHRILMAASLLHDIGAHISFKKHHKHSLYLISQSELPGFSADEMLMAANVARYHRKNSPQPDHEQFARLGRSQRQRVVKLSSLLRIADALDRDHAQSVRGVRAVLRPATLDLGITGKGLRDLDHWALQRKSQLFTEVFGLRVRTGTA